MKITRRELALSLTAGATLAVSVTAEAQTSPRDPAVAVREDMEKNSQALAKFEIPMATEPAFQFKA